MDIKAIEQRLDQEMRSMPSAGVDRSKFGADLVIKVPRPKLSDKSPADFARAIKHVLGQIPVLGSCLRLMKKFIDGWFGLRQMNDRLDEFIHHTTRQLNHVTHHLNLARGEVAELRSALARLQDQELKPSAPGAVAAEPNADLGRLYLAFEERFRAAPEQLTAGFQLYKSYLDKLPTEVRSLPCLDIGCGRGEWLSFLQTSGLSVVGVDMNSAMVNAVAAKGIAVHQDDGINFLAQQKPGSYGVVSAFHVVEHLSLSQLLRLIDESFRVLAPGGIAIFETPNPENILVGACNFYTDPTHKNPLPPHTLDFMVLQRGFDHTSVLRKGAVELAVSSNDPAVNFMLDWFKKEQDYAIIAYKA